MNCVAPDLFCQTAMIRQINVVCLLCLLLVVGCGADVSLDRIAELASAQGAPAPTPTATVTTLPSLRTILPADMTATAESNFIQPAVVHTATPNPIATEAPPTEQPTEVPAAESTAGEAASAEIAPTKTPLPQPTATPEPSLAPAVPPAISLRTPLAGSQFIAGTGIDVSGDAGAITTGQLIRVALLNAQGAQLADATLIASAGDWRVILPVSAEITGPLTVRATVVAPDGQPLAEATTPIEAIGNITLSEIPEDDYFISLDRASVQAIAGRGVFLNGRSGSPLDVYDVTLEVFYQDCTIGAGPISFQMFGSGGWNGYLIIPSGTQGSTVCIRAHTGTPGTDSYRQAEQKYVVLDSLAPESRTVEVAVPRPNSYYTVPFDISGVAINAPLGYVLVQVIAQDGSVLWQDTVTPDGYGNWTIRADFALAASTPINIAAIVDNTDGTYTTDQHTITVEPVGLDN